MTKRIWALAAVLMLLSCSVAGAATVSLDNGGGNFGSGDVWKLSAGLANPGGAVAVDAYLALVLPDGTLAFFQLTPSGLAASIGTSEPSTWKPFFANVTLPPGLNTGLVHLLDIPINETIPAGIYTTAFVITQAGTLNIIASEVKPFLVGRFSQPVSAYLGTYRGTWHNTTFGSSGSVLISVADTAAGSLTATMTLGGNVFGVGHPAPIVHTISLSPDGTISFAGPSPLGAVSGTLGPAGAVNVTIAQVGNGIDSAVFSGTIVPGNINLVYTVNFIAGGTASGTFIATRP